MSTRFMKQLLICYALAVGLLSGAIGEAATDVVIADFEGANYGGWEVTGNAFGPGPARGALPTQMAVSGFKGNGLVNSFFNGDGSTGTLTSPEFRIECKFISFLIGGGMDASKTCMNLLIRPSLPGASWRNSKMVRNSTGVNNEELVPVAWDVSELIGKTARIQIVDTAVGGWGHINVDQIVQTDSIPPQMLIMNAKREFKIEKNYLNLPIAQKGSAHDVAMLVDGRLEVKNSIILANAAPDWWAFIDVSAWRGKTVTLVVDRLMAESTALSSIEQSDEISGAENLYREPLRGQFHFSSRRGWNNDPNGMVFFNGEYHLFYQHNPYGWSWGNMHWGHAVSPDMVHWQELRDELAPDELGPMFSGSAVVDRKNTSGLGKDGKPPLVLIYTAYGNPATQCIASSTDGRNFAKYSGNPVLKNITGGNRDPKVIWHEPTKTWVMTLFVQVGNVPTIHFLSSPNLKDWTLMSKTDGFHECPDFFELPVDGNAATKKWVITGASSEYMVGAFDGAKFTPETPKLPGHRGLGMGQGFYAAQTFSDIPVSDGRRIQIGWFQTETRGMPFNQSMSIPLELKLIATPDGTRMTWTPVKELASLRAKSHRLDPMTLKPESVNPLADIKAELVELRAEFEPGDANEVVFNVRGATIVYDTKKQELAVNGHRAPAPLRGGKQHLTVFCDRTGLELFVSDGLTYMPMSFQPKADDLSLGMLVKGGSARISALEVHELKSAWNSRNSK